MDHQDQTLKDDDDDNASLCFKVKLELQWKNYTVNRLIDNFFSRLNS
jgi:hypothetical protein